MQYSEALAERPIWIALSKVDQLEAEELETMLEAFAETFPERPIYGVSALGDIGLPELCQDLMLALQEKRLRLREDDDFADQQQRLEERISKDVWAHSERMRTRRRGDPPVENSDDLDDGEYLSGDDATEVVYVRD